MITVVIPVYNQRDLTVQCMKSVLAAVVDQDWQLVVIDDCSTDVGMSEALAVFANHPRVSIVRNEANLGFTKTANKGIELADADSHVLLLNSDTVVYDHWLDAMHAGLFRGEKIATITPLTNQRGSHISCYPNPLWENVDNAELDDRELASLAYSFSPDAIADVHTGVGFCLLINRKAIQSVGRLDEVRFPRGYGEESDFCYRATEMGWRHLVCGGTFVTHVHGQSFGEEKARLRKEMLETFRRLHPNQPTVDRLFRENDPVRNVRMRLDLARLNSLIEGPREYRTLEVQEAGMAPDASVWLEIKGDEVSFRISGSVVGVPNIGSYKLPSDLGRFVSDLEKLGVMEVFFRTRSDLASESAELARYLGMNARVQKQDGAFILSWKARRGTSARAD